MSELKVIKKPSLKQLVERIDQIRLDASHEFDPQERVDHEHQDMLRRFQDILDAYASIIDDPDHRAEIERQMRAFLGDVHFGSLLTNNHIVLMNSKEFYGQITQFAEILQDETIFCYTPLRPLAAIIASEFGRVSVMDPINAVLDFVRSYADLGVTQGALTDIRYRNLEPVDVCIYDCTYSLGTWARDLTRCIMMARRHVIFQTPVDLGVAPGIIDLLEALKSQGGLQGLLMHLDIRNVKAIDQLMAQRMQVRGRGLRSQSGDLASGGVLDDDQSSTQFVEAKYDDNGNRTQMGVFDSLVSMQPALAETRHNIAKVHENPQDYFVLGKSPSGHSHIYTAMSLDSPLVKNVLYVTGSVKRDTTSAKFGVVLPFQAIDGNTVKVVDAKRSPRTSSTERDRAIGLGDGVKINYRENLTPGQVAQLGLSPVVEASTELPLVESPENLLAERQQAMNQQLAQLQVAQAQQSDELVAAQQQGAMEVQALRGELATLGRVVDATDLNKLEPIRFKEWKRVSTLKVDKRELYTYLITV